MIGELNRNERLGIDGWVKCSLGDPDVSTIIMGQSPDSATYNTSRVGLPFFQGKADFGRRNPVPRTWCCAPTRVAEAGDILVSVRAPVGDANIANERCCIGRGISALRPGPKVHGEFLFYLLLYRKEDLDALGSGAIFKAINKDTLQAFEIDLPRLPEQRAIAGVLAKMQAAVEVQERIVATLRELKASAMAKLFREGLRGEPLKQTEMGEMPDSWEIVRLGDYCRISSGGTPARDVAEYWNGSIPWVKTGEIDYRPIAKTEEYITEAGLQNSSAKLFPRGTLLMAMYGQGVTRGKVAFLGIEAATNQACAAIFPSESLDSGYLYAFCAFAYDRIRDLGHGANQKNLSADIIREMLLPLPTNLEEQREIYRVVNLLESRLEIAERNRDRLKSVFSSVPHLLMTGRVRVTRKMIALQSLADRAARRPKWCGTVDEKLLQEAVRRIVEVAAPEKIILFGSAARGEMGPDSDLDLLVVKACDSPREVERVIYRRLIGIGVPKDVLVVTPEHLEKHKDTIGYIYRPALREGKVIYAA